MPVVGFSLPALRFLGSVAVNFGMAGPEGDSATVRLEGDCSSHNAPVLQTAAGKCDLSQIVSSRCSLSKSKVLNMHETLE